MKETARFEKKRISLKKLILIMIIVIAAVSVLGTWALGDIAGSNTTPVPVIPPLPPLHNIAPAITLLGNPDVHDLNAQILVNTTYTQGYKGYLTAQYPSGIVTTNLIITARSPGISTLTLSVNGSYLIRDYPFVNITTQNFMTPISGNETFLITIHSDAMNFTRILEYYGIVYSPLQFINYETSLISHVPALGMGVDAGFLTFAPAAGMAVFVAQQTGLFSRKSRSSHPNLNNDIIGGSKNEK